MEAAVTDKKYISDNKRVILITGDNSKWYEQAIFIVRKSSEQSMPSIDFVKEAEKIIQCYMTGASLRTEKLPDGASFSGTYPSLKSVPNTAGKQNIGISRFLNVVMLVICIIMAVLTLNSIIA